MEKIISLIAIVFISGLVGVISLQCYVCVDCPNPTDADLLTCADNITPTMAPKTLSKNGPTSPTTKTTSPTTTTTSPTIITTSPTTTTPTTEQPPEPSNEDNNRSKRSILTMIDQAGCDCDEDGCDCNGWPFFNRVAQYADDFVCVKATITVNGTGITIRDCAYANSTDGLTPCEAVQNVTSVSECSMCNFDKCNSAITLHYSTFMIFASLCYIILK